MDEDALSFKGIDHLEFYVGNARQSAQFYRQCLGFDIVARKGLETGCRDRTSYLLQQGDIRFVLTTALTPDHEISRRHVLHGDAVKAIALEVGSVDEVVQEVKDRGATILEQQHYLKDKNGNDSSVRIGEIAYAGDLIFRFVEREGYDGFEPMYSPQEEKATFQPGLRSIDHVVTNVHLGEMNHYVNWFEEILGFRNLYHFTDKDISTEYSALMSKVMENGERNLKFPINEPAEGRKKSQIAEYLDYNLGPGVQHIAMTSDDICHTVGALKEHGMKFLSIPPNYYDSLKERVPEVSSKVKELQVLGILADKDDEGYLLQIFSGLMQDRPTLFMEVIQRCGSRGFGHGNFQALFESIEKAQADRGNL